MSASCCSFSERIVHDLVRAVCNDTSLTSFEIIPMNSSENKNSSPVLRGGETLGLESWVIRHVLPHAHKVALESPMHKDGEKLSPFLLTVNLLNPDMPTAWCRRRELIMRRKLPSNNELRVTRMILSRSPKCNEALAHRRWLINQKLITGDDVAILDGELSLINLIADRYHSNYHAWTHRQWAMQRFAPTNSKDAHTIPSLQTVVSKRTMCYIFARTSLPLYMKELETSSQFISTHVSDYSGMHYRQFLLKSIFTIMREGARDDDTGDKRLIDGDSSSEALLFYSSVKPEISDFLTGEIDSNVTTYLDGLEQSITLFDIVIGLLLIDLKLNASLNNLYIDHEALWCFRKSLLNFFLEYVNELNTEYNNNSDSRHVTHKVLVHDVYCQHADVTMFTAKLLHREQNLIKSMNIGDYRSIRNYSVWLQRQDVYKSNG